MAPEELGRYRLRRVLGRGGRPGLFGGEVWEAEDGGSVGPEGPADQTSVGPEGPADKRSVERVALKILRVDDEAMLPTQALFIEQARRLTSLRHPNVMRVHDAGEAGGTSFVVMELVSGRSLGDAIDATVQERVRWLREAAFALSALHAAGVVHRDVKPQNILVREDGTACLVDLGVPLEVEGEMPDGARDDQAAWAEVARALLAADAPAHVVRVVDRAGAADPETRFPSMKDVALALGGDEAPDMENAAVGTGRAPVPRTLSLWVAVAALVLLIAIAALLQRALLD